MEQEKLKEILKLHKDFLIGKPRGILADLSKTDLSNADLSGADLRDANLSGANLSEALLSGANLWGADLRDALLNSADLSHANLSHANLSNANLNYAGLSNAHLSNANLRGAYMTNTKVRLWQSDAYSAYTTPGAEGQVLSFGCCRFTLDHWEKNLEEICLKYEPDRVDQYVAEIGALITLCRVVEKEWIHKHDVELSSKL